MRGTGENHSIRDLAQVLAAIDVRCPGIDGHPSVAENLLENFGECIQRALVIEDIRWHGGTPEQAELKSLYGGYIEAYQDALIDVADGLGVDVSDQVVYMATSEVVAYGLSADDVAEIVSEAWRPVSLDERGRYYMSIVR